MSKSFIPLSVPHLTSKTAQYLEECVTTGYVSSVGAFVDRFEKDLADYTGSKHAVAVMNGTSALHLALITAGVEADQEVLTPSLTFVATANAVRYIGAYPVLVDVRPDTWNIDLDLVERFLAEQCEERNGKLINHKSGRAVVAILPVHLYGFPVDMNRLRSIAEKYALAIVEDAAESIGATYNGRMTGTLGDLGILSFNGNKTITAGAGGAILTDNEEYAKRAKHLSTQAKQDPLRYLHDEIGFNYRMSNLQAAVGVAQLEELESFLDKKRAIYHRYRDAFREYVDSKYLQFQVPSPDSESSPTYWLNAILFKLPTLKDAKEPWEKVVKTLSEQQIQARPFWHPLHLLEPNSDLQVLGGSVTEDICRYGVCLPSSVSLTEEDQQRVIEAVVNFIKSEANG